MCKVLRPALPPSARLILFIPRRPLFRDHERAALSRVRSTAKPLALDYASGSDKSGTGGGDIKSIVKDRFGTRIEEARRNADRFIPLSPFPPAGGGGGRKRKKVNNVCLN